MAIFGKRNDAGPSGNSNSLLSQVTRGSAVEHGWRFSLKGSPRFYDDVLRIIESDPGAKVYFGEALTYERGAAVALWDIDAGKLADFRYRGVPIAALADRHLELVGG